MSLRRRAPRPIEQALTPISRAWQPESLLAEVQRVWRSAVGEVIAGEATPVSERGGVVSVVCSASVWAQELELMSPSIVTALNEALHGQRVAKLRCSCAPGPFSG